MCSCKTIQTFFYSKKNKNMRRFAISDIHGCAVTFKNLLHQISFSKEDVLYLLGDYIDRGPDSRGVIDHIWYLQKEGYQVHCLRGNHEQNLLDAYSETRFECEIPKETLLSFEVKTVKDIPKVYIRWMEKLPYYFDLEDYILVHAGLNFNLAKPLDDHADMIWIRHWYDNIDSDWLGGRIIVHGHTPTRQLEIKRSINTLDEIPAIDIDAGCVFESFGLGNLCVLNLDTKKLRFAANQEVVYH